MFILFGDSQDLALLLEILEAHQEATKERSALRIKSRHSSGKKTAPDKNVITEIKMVVMARDYTHTALTTAQMGTIQNAIMDKVVERKDQLIKPAGWCPIFKFNVQGSEFVRSGFVKIIKS